MESILQTRGLHKQYKGIRAVHDLNMTIREGEIYGFLGQNGAGKTTAIRMIMGLVQPTGGEIELFGERVKPGSHRLYRRVGSIIEYPGFYPNLTGLENLETARCLMGLPDRNCLEEALHIVGLWEARNRKTSQYSLGMKQRLGIAKAILHRPDFLILDEPTNGLDPMGIKEVRQLIIGLARERNITILVSSHILSEVEQLATRIGIIHQGIMLEEIELSALRERSRQYLKLNVDRPEKAIELLRGEFRISDIQQEEEGILRIYEKRNEASRINRVLVNAGLEVSGLIPIQDSLEDYFIRLIGGDSVG